MLKYFNIIRIKLLFCITISLLFITACTEKIPQTAERTPWFETESDLLIKAEILEESTLEMTDTAGVHCYKAYLPWEKIFDEKHLSSYDMADYPAWQGYLLAAFAFKEAVLGESQEEIISLLIDGLRYSWKVTGVDGLLCRSLLPGYQGVRLDYMDTQAENPTKYWSRSLTTGEWFKNGVAAGHYSGTVFGLSILLYLQRQGDISLSAAVEERAIETLVTTVRYVLDNDYMIIDFDGKMTDYGLLDPQLFNSYFAVAMLNYLKAAGYYDETCARAYEDNVELWTNIAEDYNRLLGDTMLGIGRWTLEKISTSDTLHYACQNYSLMLMEKETPYAERLASAADSVWDFFQYERHPIYTFMFIEQVRPEDKDLFLPAIIEDLRDFPDDKKVGREKRKETPAFVQPLANRHISTYYWKSTCYSSFVDWKEDPDEDSVTFSGGDYLFAYWMGRYVGLVPER